MEKFQKAAGVFLTPLLLAALVMVMTGCPNPEDPEPETGFAKLLPSEGEGGDCFGQSVSIDGDYAIVGAVGDDDSVFGGGAAYVFVRSGTVWTRQAKLTADDGEYEDSFGNCVSISGNYAIVGAWNDDEIGTSSGSAYVFVRSGTVWTQQAKLVPGDGAAYDYFGNCVSISGDYAIVGSHYDDDNGAYTGSAYVFARSDTTWTEQDKLLPSDSAAYDYFGDSVSISGDYAIVGSGNKDGNKGAAYVFMRSDTDWTQQEKLTASDGVGGDYFGYSVSIKGASVILGARGVGGTTGAAYVFVRSGTDWAQQDKLVASDGAGIDWFGCFVSIDGDHAIVGAYQDDDDGNNSGSAYLFVRSGTDWTQQEKYTADDGAADDYFGYSVAISGDYAIVGSHRDDDNGSDSGSAYIFY